MAYITINYSGGDIYEKDSDKVIGNDFVYESVELSSSIGEEKFIFDSGNLVKDWFDAIKKYHTEIQEKEPYLSMSSSVDHFQWDGGKFDSAYLHFDDDVPVLKYLDRSDPNWVITQDYIFDKGLEFFVTEGTQPTWEELKEMSK